LLTILVALGCAEFKLSHDGLDIGAWVDAGVAALDSSAMSAP